MPNRLRHRAGITVRRRTGLWTRQALGRGHLPNAIILGAQKAGTTSLFQYLAQHADIGTAVAKEVHFFDNAFGKGLRWYKAHFPDARPVVLEGSPYYLFHPLAPERARRTVPDAKLIVLLRDPIARAYSHYQHAVARGLEHRPFEDAIAQEPAAMAEAHEAVARGIRRADHQHWSYISRGLYAPQVERWLRYFPRSSFLFLKAEGLFRDPQGEVDAVCDFLGIGRLAIPDLRPRHQRLYSAMDPEMREMLVATFGRARGVEGCFSVECSGSIRLAPLSTAGRSAGERWRERPAARA